MPLDDLRIANLDKNLVQLWVINQEASMLLSLKNQFLVAEVKFISGLLSEL